MVWLKGVGAQSIVIKFAEAVWMDVRNHNPSPWSGPHPATTRGDFINKQQVNVKSSITVGSCVRSPVRKLVQRDGWGAPLLLFSVQLKVGFEFFQHIFPLTNCNPKQEMFSVCDALALQMAALPLALMFFVRKALLFTCVVVNFAMRVFCCTSRLINRAACIQAESTTEAGQSGATAGGIHRD